MKHISDQAGNINHGLQDRLLSDKKHLRILFLKKTFIHFAGSWCPFCIAWVIYGSSLFAFGQFANYFIK